MVIKMFIQTYNIVIIVQKAWSLNIIQSVMCQILGETDITRTDQ